MFKGTTKKGISPAGCRARSLKVVFVVCDQMLSTSVTLPMELLRAAESLSRLSKYTEAEYAEVKSAYLKKTQTKKAETKEREILTLDVVLVSIDGKAVQSHTGISLQPDTTYQTVEQADIVYFPALWRNPMPAIKKNSALLPWVTQLSQQDSLVVGVGTGCCFMAEAGLLEHRPATTHWHYFDQFVKKYPNVQLKRKHFITQSENLYCAGSVNSLADLTVHFIQRYFGGKVAHLVERNFFHEIRKAYDTERVFHDYLQAHPDEDIIQIQVWLKDHMRDAIHFGDVARYFDMSVRNLSRRFKAATGVSPLQYLQKIRMDTAKDLLKTSNLSVIEVMYETGYQDSAYFSTLFKKYHDTTPRQYRTTVRSKLFQLN